MSKKNSPPVTSANRDIVLEMTPQKYEEMKARGIAEEAIPTPGPHVFRRRTRRLDPSAAKIKVTAWLDADVVAYFNRRAQEPAAAPLAVQLNQALRAAMVSEQAREEAQLQVVTEKLLHNEAFLHALSEKLKAA